jgi:pyridoxal biosynthesis lyase PdxS
VIEFVFMLTHHDRTVDDPIAVYEQIRGCGLRYIGFKDIGVPVAELKEVCARAHGDGLEVMLEVVSTTREEELRSVAASAEIGVDWLLGGTHPEDGLEILSGGASNERPRYCPFPGTVVGHPSILQGEIDEIAESARRITALDGVFGLDLLAYRHQSADAAELTRAVVQAASGPVIAAGSVATTAQIGALDQAGAWGFTIGGAIFEERLPGGPSIAGQVTEVLRAARGGPGAVPRADTAAESP